jgi:4Fe-4S iron-sulfur cluster binding domain/DR2241 stabilising domain
MACSSTVALVMATDSPSLRAFTAQLGDTYLIAQVVVSRRGAGYELRHRSDGDRPAEQLRAVAQNDLRGLAQTTASGAFRPLKSAPNLVTGWRAQAKDDAELGWALNQLYPGAVADWHAAQQPEPPITHFRQFTSRQTGMYRITARLSDAQAAAVIRACCPPRFCLKRRLWTAGTEPSDEPAGKSLIPCLEPCAVFLEFARKIARIEQEKPVTTTAGRSELETILAALAAAMGEPAPPPPREADFSAASNPRRVAWVQERMRLLAERK